MRWELVMQNKEKQYFMTKCSDRKDKCYSYIKELAVGEDDFPTKEALDELVVLEEERNVAFLITDAHIKVISFKSDFKFCAKVIGEMEKFYNNLDKKKVYFSGNERTLKIIDEYMGLFNLNKENTDEMEVSNKQRRI